jgi:pantoate ligase/cytidylate kinase
MHVFNTIVGLRTSLQEYTKKFGDGVNIGLVPTMGCLHAGHLSLIKQARQDNQIVVVSIFVNPLQFSPQEDLAQYPRQLESDRLICQEAGVDLLFTPSSEALGISQQPTAGEISPNMIIHPPANMTNIMCGKSRPGHFQGVITIVTKLFNIVQPTRAYFGQKDSQQLAIIKKLVNDLNIPVEIIPCPTVRESTGLAFSSRNQYLNETEKEQAAILYRALQQGEKTFHQRLQNTEDIDIDQTTAIKNVVAIELANVPNMQIEYVELVDPNTLQPLSYIEKSGLLAIAARIGNTRLIDNIILRNRRPIITIDGPAGAGKSTVTKLVAKELGLLYLDTGAMYRAVTWLVLNQKISVHDQPAIAELVDQCQIEFTGPEKNQVVINGQDVTQAIRSLEVTSNVSAIAAQAIVRYFMVRQQRELGAIGDLVGEGRDLGTHVFPDAELKIFLTATVQERARRRFLELQAQGETQITLAQLEIDIAERDRLDSSRIISPLRKAEDAQEIYTDNLSIPEVVDTIVNLYKKTVGEI